jgi:gamma-polyglutamate synthase
MNTTLIFLLLLIVMGFLFVEKLLHDRRVRRIPIRIHVNGTRGKSTVVRLTAAALREAGVKTLAKTTGTTPTLIYPDGREAAIPRRGPSRIHEQMSFMKKAAAMGVEAVVVECMAIDPHLQFISEVEMIKSTLGVITNVRPDHFEVMGGNLEEIAESLSGTIPRNGTLVVGESRYFDLLKLKAMGKNTEAFLVEREGSPITQNAAIAEMVCTLSGVGHPLVPSSDGPEVVRKRAGDRTIYFIDAFSANDVHSTRIMTERIWNKDNYPRPFVALFNNRADRPLRMLSFASFLSREPSYDYIMLIGESRWLAERYMKRKRTGGKVIVLGPQNAASLIEEIGRKMSALKFTLIGMGNYKGPGEEVSRFFQSP